MTRYKLLFACSVALTVVLSISLLGVALTEKPGSIPLGVGMAGVADSISIAGVLNRDTTLADQRPEARAASDEEDRRELPLGEASFYGNELVGQPTASGEPFDPAQLTAAHRTLPFGTRLRVTNISNGRSVIVRVNDRGPFSSERVLDLSYSAARQIGMIGAGQTRVRMEVLR